MRLIDSDKLCEDLLNRWNIADIRKEKLIKQVMADIVTPIVVGQPSVHLDAPNTNVVELISKQDAIDVWKEDFKGFVNSLDMPRDDYKGIMEYIDELSSVQPRKGEWIYCRETGYGNPYGHYECSLCGDGYGYKTNFCPNCGSYNGGDSNYL